METMSSQQVPPDPTGSPCSKRIKLSLMDDFNDSKFKTFLKDFTFMKLLQEKKLSLVLDLDQTLLHTVRVSNLTPEDRDFILKETYDPKLSDLFRIKFGETEDFVTKLRPGLQQFLEEASKIFELHVFSKGCQEYVAEVLKLIDPGKKYFGCKASSLPRVFTRESCAAKKSLDVVTGEERGILIVDDKDSVWRDVDKENVLQIPKYDFFELGNGPILSAEFVERGDQSEYGRWLDMYLWALKMIHAMFFDPNGQGDVKERDVRVMKKKLFNTRFLFRRQSSSKETQ